MGNTLEGSLRIKVRDGKICLGKARLEDVYEMSIDYLGEVPVARIGFVALVNGLYLEGAEESGRAHNILRYEDDGVYLDGQRLNYIKGLVVVSRAEDGDFSRVVLEIYIDHKT